MIRLIKR